MSVWLVKCRRFLKDGSEGWHWDQYFNNEGGLWSRNEEWGGPDWIRAAASMKWIREEVAKGDLVVCYQFEGTAILGMTQMAASGSDGPPGSGYYNIITLIPSSKALRLNPPITVKQLRDNDCDSEYFGPKGQGTLFPLSDSEFKGIIDAIKLYCPKTISNLDRWLKRAKYEAY